MFAGHQPWPKIERVHELYEYDPQDGSFIWRHHNSLRWVGQVAGYIDKLSGMSRIRVDGVQYHAHHLAWALFFGEFPKGDVHHRNFITNDNRIENLEEVLEPNSIYVD